METWRQKAGILVMVLCLGMVLAALWYCLFVMPLKGREKGGTLVQVMDKGEQSLAEAETDVCTAWPGTDAGVCTAWPGTDAGVCAAWPGTALSCESEKTVMP